MDEVITAPWWAKRIRHGSLSRKRLAAFVCIVSAGVIWFVGDLYDIWLSFCTEYESGIYGHWFIRLGSRLGMYSLPKEARITPVFAWIDAIGDIGFFVTLGWGMFWIYCDSICSATEQCHETASPSRAMQRMLFYHYFMRGVGAPVLVAVILYGGAWLLFHWSGTEARMRQEMQLLAERHGFLKATANADGYIRGQIGLGL
jgi:hypothetical protein